jgi:hypothetical protein
MKVDLDGILGNYDGWSLSVTIGGTEIEVPAPPPGVIPNLERILIIGNFSEDQRAGLERMLATLVPGHPLAGFGLDILVAIASAIVLHARQVQNKNGGIPRKIVNAMREADSAAEPPPVARAQTLRHPIQPTTGIAARWRRCGRRRRPSVHVPRRQNR